MFEHIYISETIYKVVVETSCQKKTNIAYDNRSGINKKMRVVDTPSNSYSNISFHTLKYQQTFKDIPSDRSKRTCLIRGIGHFSEQ